MPLPCTFEYTPIFVVAPPVSKICNLFEGVVQRFNERVSIDSLSKVYFDKAIRDEIIDSFNQCCRYMEGHLHSDKYGYKKPKVGNLKEEIERFDELKKRLKELKKTLNLKSSK